MVTLTSTGGLADGGQAKAAARPFVSSNGAAEQHCIYISEGSEEQGDDDADGKQTGMMMSMAVMASTWHPLSVWKGKPVNTVTSIWLMASNAAMKDMTEVEWLVNILVKRNCEWLRHFRQQ